MVHVPFPRNTYTFATKSVSSTKIDFKKKIKMHSQTNKKYFTQYHPPIDFEHTKL